jgi:ribonuclease-3
VADLRELENKIQYVYKDKSLLTEALTHSSYAHEGRKKLKCNERMEFLGDAVLSIVSAEYLYNKFPEAQEGELTKLRSSLVCTESLSKFARELNLSDYIIMGKGAMLRNDAERPSVLENTFEAIIASIYLDSGMAEAKRFILSFLEEEIKHHSINFKDYKSMFQIIAQQNPDEHFQYQLVNESGPDHDKRYEVELRLNSNVVGRGAGSSKKQAEQEAAREALELMGVEL